MRIFPRVKFKAITRLPGHIVRYPGQLFVSAWNHIPGVGLWRKGSGKHSQSTAYSWQDVALNQGDDQFRSEQDAAELQELVVSFSESDQGEIDVSQTQVESNSIDEELSELISAQESLVDDPDAVLEQLADSPQPQEEPVSLGEEFVQPPEAEQSEDEEAIPVFDQSSDDVELAIHQPYAEFNPSFRTRLQWKASDFASSVFERVKSPFTRVWAYVPKRKHNDSPEDDSYSEEPEYLEAEPVARTHWVSLTLPEKEERWWAPRRWAQIFNDFVRRRTLALTVENGVVRMVVFQGKEAIAWGTAVPDDEITFALSESGTLEPSDAPRIATLVHDLNFRRLRVITELPLYSPLLRHLNLSRIKKAYLEEVVTAEVGATIPFPLDDVDIKWQARNNGTDVFAIAVPKAVVDNHSDVLKRAKITPMAAYSRAVSLSFATGLRDVITIHHSMEEAAIVLTRDQIPRVVHKVEILPYEMDTHAQAAAIERGVEHVYGYFSSQESITQQIHFPVVFTGYTTFDDSLIEEFKELTEYKVLPFEPPLQYSEYLPTTEYATNIGLAIADRARGRLGRLVKPKGPAVSLLSQRHLPRPLPILQAAVFAMLFLVGAAAFGVTTQVDAQTLEATTLSSRASSLEREAREHRLIVGRTRSYTQRIDSIKVLNGNLESRLGDLATGLRNTLDRMEMISRHALPSDVRVESFSLEGKEFNLSGAASSYEALLEYTSNLRAAGPELFSDARIVQVDSIIFTQAGESDGSSNTGVGFRVIATIPDDPALGEDEAETGEE